MDIAGELIGDHQIGERSHRAVDPVVQPVRRQRVEHFAKAAGTGIVDLFAAGIPAGGTDLFNPELQNLDRVRHHHLRFGARLAAGARLCNLCATSGVALRGNSSAIIWPLALLRLFRIRCWWLVER